MKVILLEHIPSLGSKGEQKEVKDGFAQNFLIPQKKAVPFTVKNAQKYLQVQKQAQEKQQKAAVSPQDLANRLRALTLDFAEKADETGTFFAGITKEKILKALAEKKLVLKPKQLKLSQPIKKAGDFTVEVDVAAGVKSQIKIITEENKN